MDIFSCCTHINKSKQKQIQTIITQQKQSLAKHPNKQKNINQKHNINSKNVQQIKLRKTNKNKLQYDQSMKNCNINKIDRDFRRFGVTEFLQQKNKEVRRQQLDHFQQVNNNINQNTIQNCYIVAKQIKQYQIRQKPTQQYFNKTIIQPIVQLRCCSSSKNLPQIQTQNSINIQYNNYINSTKPTSIATFTYTTPSQSILINQYQTKQHQQQTQKSLTNSVTKRIQQLKYIDTQSVCDQMSSIDQFSFVQTLDGGHHHHENHEYVNMLKRSNFMIGNSKILSTHQDQARISHRNYQLV